MQYLVEEQVNIRAPTTTTDLYKQFNIWIDVEFGFFGGTLITYSVFFLLRSFFEQRLSVRIKIALHNPETDFIVAEQIVI